VSGAVAGGLHGVVAGLHVTGWALVYSLVIGCALGAAFRLVLIVMRDRSAWARYALCCVAMVLTSGVVAQSWMSIRSAYAGHDSLVERYAADLMREGSPHPVGPLPGGWTADALSRAVEAMHDHQIEPWIDGPTASTLGNLLALAAALWLAVEHRQRRARLANQRHPQVSNQHPAGCRTDHARGL
jgi:hypothetical protein